MGDTFVHHGGSFTSNKKMPLNLRIGREFFRWKYLGIDAWKDARPINTRCRCDILGIKNVLRRQEQDNVSISEVTNDM